jgi:hypothetical protein
MTLQSLSMDETCFSFESSVTVPRSDSFCTATAGPARSQLYCSCSQSRTTIRPALYPCTYFQWTGHVSISSHPSQFVVHILADTIAAVPRAEQHSIQHHEPALTFNGQVMFQFRVIRHSSSFTFFLTLLQLFPGQNSTQSSIMILHSLSLDESCFNFESTVTVLHSHSFCTATAVTASSQHRSRCSPSSPAHSPAA